MKKKKEKGIWIFNRFFKIFKVPSIAIALIHLLQLLVLAVTGGFKCLMPHRALFVVNCLKWTKCSNLMDCKKKLYLEEWNKCSAPSFTRQQPNPPIILNEMTNLSCRGGTCLSVCWCLPTSCWMTLLHTTFFLHKCLSKS